MSDDMISRNTIYEYYSRECVGHCSSCDYWDEKTDKCGLIDKLPAVQPKQKTGRWIYTNTIGGMRYYGCTICTNQEKDCIADENEIQWYNYCPNCGAKMEA